MLKPTYWLTRFNPCYSGSNSKMKPKDGILTIIIRFNPCYSGSNSKIKYLDVNLDVKRMFQSLL